MGCSNRTELTRFRSSTRLILAWLDININGSGELTLPGDAPGVPVDPDGRSPSDLDVVLCQRVRILRRQQRPGSIHVLPSPTGATRYGGPA